MAHLVQSLINGCDVPFAQLQDGLGWVVAYVTAPVHISEADIGVVRFQVDEENIVVFVSKEILRAVVVVISPFTVV